MLTRRAKIVGSIAGREGGLGRDQQPIALALDRLAEDLAAYGSVEGVPRLEGRNAHILISPTKATKST